MRKNENSRNEFKSNILANNKILLLSLFVVILCVLSIYPIYNNNIVYAEETESLTTPQILNFNQLIPNNYINYTNSSTGWFNYNSNANISNGDILFITLEASNINNPIVLSDSATTNEQTIIAKSDIVIDTKIYKIVTSSGNYNYINTYYEVNEVKFNYFNIINLSLMYGDNTPTLEECKTIFTSEYYNYTTGTPINANYFSNYLDAYNDIMQSYKYQLSTTALSNYTFSYDFNGDESYFEYRDDGNHTWYFLNTFAVPLFTKINANAQVTINYYFYAPNFTADYYLNIMAYDSNGNLITIFTETTPIDTGNAQQTTFTLPFDVDVLFFNCRYNNNIITSANFMLYNFEISANQLDLTTLAFNAQESAREYFELYYGVGGQGYNNIYNVGYSAGSDSQKPFTDTWDFIGQSFHGVGEILAMELIPGLPIGLFVALPLLVGLLFFIVKIAKGSGG